MKRLPIILNVILFALLCVILSYWGLQIFRPTIRPMQAPVTVDNYEPNVGQWGNLFGVSARLEAAPSSYQLKGVIVAPSAKDSVAIIVVEGKPNFTIGLGKELMPGVRLEAVKSDHVMVSESGISRRIDLPAATSSSGIVSMPANVPPTYPNNTVAPMPPPGNPPVTLVSPAGR